MESSLGKHLFLSRCYWDDEWLRPEGISAVEYVRAVYSDYFRFFITNPDLHNFFLQESQLGNSRRSWFVDTILRPRIKRLILRIEAAQGEARGGTAGESGPHPLYACQHGHHISSMKGEIDQTGGIKVDDPIVESLWR